MRRRIEDLTLDFMDLHLWQALATRFRLYSVSMLQCGLLISLTVLS